MINSWQLSVLQLLGGQRGQQGLPKSVSYLPISVVKRFAQGRRLLGWYDARTLALFHYCWRYEKTLSTLLAYLFFRRDLGLPLTVKQCQCLQKNHALLSSAHQGMIYYLLHEMNVAVPNLPLLNATQAQILAQQTVWQEEFARWLQARTGGICVVGNSGYLIGQEQGYLIDRHQTVVRFNQFRGVNSDDKDIGQRLSIWVTAPNCQNTPPAQVSWVILTGTVAFKLKDWSRFDDFLANGGRVLTVPLEQWRVLVAQLSAPPSAGLLFLAWLHHLLGSWQSVKALGFGYTQQKTTAYHHTNKQHAPASRHHWAGERLLLQTWQTEGLNIDLPD
jgi:hypothetical protein